MEALMGYGACNNVCKQPHRPSFPRSSPSALFSVCFSASCLACPDKAAVPEDYSSMSGTCSCPPDLLASHRTRPVWKQTLQWPCIYCSLTTPPPPCKRVIRYNVQISHMVNVELVLYSYRGANSFLDRIGVGV